MARNLTYHFKLWLCFWRSMQGTKTRCLLADETKILGRAATGSVKLMRVSEAEASSRLRAMLAEVSQVASINLGEVSHTCVGLAGLSIDALAGKGSREAGFLVPFPK